MSVALLKESVQFLKGVGPRRADVLAETGVGTVGDLLSTYPRRYLDRTNVVRIRNARPGAESVTVVGTVVSTGMKPGRRGRRFEIVIEDEPARRMTCVWFQGVTWVSKAFEIGQTFAFSGKPQKFGSSVSMVHPDFDRLGDDGPALETGRIIPLYPGGQALQKVGLTSRTFRRIMYTLLKERGEELEEFLPAGLVQAEGLEDGRVARRAVHFPKNQDELRRARHRLKFEELFFFQLMLARLRYGVRKEAGPVFGESTDVGPSQMTPPGFPESTNADIRRPAGSRLPFPREGQGDSTGLVKRFLDEVLPFTLTGAQKQALADIRVDVTSGHRMNRLIQGDVGSGKTVLAVAAALMAIESGAQVAFMAPTEILSEQHAATLRGLLRPLRIPVALLTGSTSRSERSGILEGLADGSIPMVVGTHAVIQETVRFRNLGLGIVDEQHRFGVLQRARLFDKGPDAQDGPPADTSKPHVLLMTATPIPRSLALTLYGDLDVSIMRERPPGRRPITTRVVREKYRSDMNTFLRKQLTEGRQGYIVFPLVAESEKLDLKDAESGFEALRKDFSQFRVDLIHGQMKPAEKEAAMAGFVDGSTSILVSTTVIEVGVDVPNASVMIVEHAERFGLSQLHQLRGRIGRGSHPSTCFLMAEYRQSEDSRERLKTMEQTEDGFLISEKDLELRGTGDVFGTRQSGLPGFRIADPIADQAILEQARKAAFEIIDRDPDLQSPDAGRLKEWFTAFVLPRGLEMSRIG